MNKKEHQEIVDKKLRKIRRIERELYRERELRIAISTHHDSYCPNFKELLQRREEAMQRIAAFVEPRYSTG